MSHASDEFSEQICFRVIEWTVHEERSHFSEFLILERFSEDVGPHLIRRAVFEVDFIGIIFVFDKVVLGLDMLHAI